MMDALNSVSKGQQAERWVSEYLQKQGLRLLTHNYRCALGEIDLIMQDSHDVVFIEVRSRNNIFYGSAIESVDTYKQKKIIKTATHYLQKKGWLDKVDARFDIVGIRSTGANSIEWIKDAFSADD